MEVMTKEFINKYKNDILTGKDAKITVEANVRTTAGKKVMIPIIVKGISIKLYVISNMCYCN